MELSCKHKCLIKYLFDKCDNAGVFTPNWKLASLFIGEKVDDNDLMALPVSQYQVLKNGKIFLPDFIEFQYGKLSSACKPHIPVINTLEKHGLLEGFIKGIHTLEEKEKDKDKEKVKDKEKPDPEKKEIEKPKNFKDLTQQQFGQALETYKHDFPRTMLAAFYDYWREPTPSGKMRFQLERTWDLGLRLNRWEQNNFNKTQDLSDDNGERTISAREKADQAILDSVG
jgi:hypothetical protein